MSVSLTTQAEAVIYFIQEMDIDMVDLILHEDKTYQDLPKQTFIEKLGDVFTIFIDNRNSKLVGYPGFCNSDICPNGCKGGYTFIGNRSRHRIDFIIEVKQGDIMDIYQCHDFRVFNNEIIADDYYVLELNPSGNRKGWKSSDGEFDIF